MDTNRLLRSFLNKLLNSRFGSSLAWGAINVVGFWTWIMFALRERRLRSGIRFHEKINTEEHTPITRSDLDGVLPRRIIFVSTWFGTDIGGGAEAALLAMAKDVVRLYPEIKVEVATTTLKEFAADWNLAVYNEGGSIVDGILVHRFNAKSRNRQLFHFLNGRYLMGGKATSCLTHQDGVRSPVSKLAEYYYLRNMIDSPDLLKFLANEFSRTDAFIFMPYLMGPVICGARVVREKAYVFPCLHDERYAAMGIIKKFLSVVRKNLFWVRSEQKLCGTLYPLAPLGGVIGSQVAIDKFIGSPARGRATAKVGESRFLLYAGRQIEGKGLPDLVSKFHKFKSSFHQYHDLKLVLIGKGDLDYSKNPDIINLGFVSEQDKADVMSAAVALMQPSLYESFSIVMMEAWLQTTPIIVDGRCEVTRNHIEDSGGGAFYESQKEFDAVVGELLFDEQLKQRRGIAGRRYVIDNYSSERVIHKFIMELWPCL